VLWNSRVLDEFAVQLGKKGELAAALIKLHADNLSSPHNDKLYSMYHHSHPTLPERLRHMDDFAGGTKLKKRDEGKKDL
jgi:STE24 endopeptidase